tara:strand:+ start:571 stop:1206 length:636 start_codon:yes stop_codon:yes gene_type:complete
MIIDSLKQFKKIPNADRIKTEYKIPWLELDIEVPTKEILKEYLNVQSDAVLHRYADKVLGAEHKGWRSLVLHGVDKHSTEDVEGERSWTEIADKCPNTVRWVKDNFITNENTGRIRFMHLDPGGYILPHHDREQKKLQEINVAIQQPEGCVFQFLERGVIPFEDGKAFIIDVSNQHMVYNNSNQLRLHMILHCNISDELIERSYEKSYYST